MWYTVPEIQSVTDGIFWHTESQPIRSKFWKNEKKSCIYYHFTHVCHKRQSYDVWFLRYIILFLRYGTWLMYFFLILGYTLPFYPLNSPKNETLKKKMPGIIMIVIMMYDSWDMAYDRWMEKVTYTGGCPT